MIVWLKLVVGVMAALLVGLTIRGSSAFGAVTHVFEGSFGSEGEGAGQFKDPAGVAVDDTTGDVYVADPGNDRGDR